MTLAQKNENNNYRIIWQTTSVTTSCLPKPEASKRRSRLPAERRIQSNRADRVIMNGALCGNMIDLSPFTFSGRITHPTYDGVVPGRVCCGIDKLWVFTINIDLAATHHPHQQIPSINM